MLFEPNTALGHGHAAVLVGSSDSGYRLFSFYAAGGFGGALQAGVTLGDVPGEMRDPQNGKPFASLGDAMKSLPKFTKYAVWRTSKADDAAAIKAGDAWTDAKTQYNLKGRNCLNAVSHIAAAGGVNVTIKNVPDGHSSQTGALNVTTSILSGISGMDTPSFNQLMVDVASPKNTFALLEEMYRLRKKGAPDYIGSWGSFTPAVTNRVPDPQGDVGGYWGTGGQWVPTPHMPKPSVYQPPQYDPYDPTNDF